MSLLPWAQWLDASSLGTAIRDSSILFPIVETFHLLALSVLGGALLVVDLRLCGFGTRQPLPDVAKDAQPWLLGSLLGVHPPIQHAVQEMGMADRLILPAHDAERHYRAAVLDEHPGDDRVERPLARRNGVGMAGDRAKPGPAIME